MFALKIAARYLVAPKSHNVVNVIAVIAVVGEYADIYTASGEDGSLHTCMSWEDTRRAAQTPRIELACHSYYFHHLGDRRGCAKKPGEKESDWAAALTADTRALQ